MLIIDLDKDYRFIDFIICLFYDCAKFYHVDHIPRAQAKGNGLASKFYGVDRKRFLRLLEIWALKTYGMFVKFNFYDDEPSHGVCSIEIGFEDLSSEEIEYVVMNMYPKDCPTASITE